MATPTKFEGGLNREPTLENDWIRIRNTEEGLRALINDQGQFKEFKLETIASMYFRKYIFSHLSKTLFKQSHKLYHAILREREGEGERECV